MMTAFLIWIFVWDDEIDTSDSLIALDAERVRAYSQQSLNYIHQELGLSANGGKKKAVDEDQVIIEKIHPNMVLFGEVGRRLLSATDRIQRESFYHELVNYIECVEAEHAFRLRGIIPSTEEYVHARFGSVACRPFMVITE